MRLVLLVLVVGICLSDARLLKLKQQQLAKVGIPSWCTDTNAVANHAKLTSTDARCAFYTQCLEPVFQCGSIRADPNSYPINYGDRYCRKFSAATYRTSIAPVWRDATLPCLHLSLVDTLRKKLNGEAITCEQLTNIGFDSHPRCYTTPEKSICNVLLDGTVDGAHDVFSVFTTVETSDLLSLRTVKQAVDVAGRCSMTAADMLRSLVGDISPERLGVIVRQVPTRRGVYVKVRDCDIEYEIERPYFKCFPVASASSGTNIGTSKDTGIGLVHDGVFWWDRVQPINNSGYGLFWDGTNTCIRCELQSSHRLWFDSSMSDRAFTLCSSVRGSPFGQVNLSNGGKCRVYYQHNS